MFRVSTFRIAMTVSFFAAAAQYTRLVFIPLQLEGLRAYTALRVGVLLIPSALATAAGMPLGGRLVDRIGPRWPVASGCGLMAVALLLMSRLSVTAPIAMLVVLLGLQGFGMGLSIAPATVAAMNSVGKDYVAQASSMRSLSSQVAGAIAIAGLSTLVAHQLGHATSLAHQQEAYNATFLVAGVGMLGSAFLALRLPRHPYDESDGGVPLALE
jgi:MFS family permease